MERDYSDPFNPFIYRPAPKKRSVGKPEFRNKQKEHQTRKRIEEYFERQRIEREHSL